MLLTVSTTHRPATDLGYLVHKNPFRCQAKKLPFGVANIFYPEASEEKCTLAVLLDVDPVKLVRGGGKRNPNIPLEPYVNDRPYVCSSFMSIALSRTFGQTLNGICREKPELVDMEMPLEVGMSVLPCKTGEGFLKGLFEPLGYLVETVSHPLDPRFPEWGDSPYFTVRLRGKVTVKALFNHLYVLIPVLDNQKHYFIDENEINKLLKRGEGWLAEHTLRDAIARRYLKHLRSYGRQALLQLMEETEEVGEDAEDALNRPVEKDLEERLKLNDERVNAVLGALRASSAQTVVDLGCGRGRLLGRLLKERQFKKIVGFDVAARDLEIARDRLHLETLPDMQQDRIELIHGSLTYRDKRLAGFDAAVVMEVIEHFSPHGLSAFERVLFEWAGPGLVIITTPNRDYNSLWPGMASGAFRHKDHRFEWTRREFAWWVENISKKYGYAARIQPVGPNHERFGAPTQMCILKREDTIIP